MTQTKRAAAPKKAPKPNPPKRRLSRWLVGVLADNAGDGVHLVAPTIIEARTAEQAAELYAVANTAEPVQEGERLRVYPLRTPGEPVTLQRVLEPSWASNA